MFSFHIFAVDELSVSVSALFLINTALFFLLNIRLGSDDHKILSTSFIMMIVMTMEIIIIAGGSLAMECPAAASALIVFPHPQCNALALGSESEHSVHIALYIVQSVQGLFNTVL